MRGTSSNLAGRTSAGRGLLLGACLAALLTGCADSDSLVDATGRVLVDGEPLPGGTVVLAPLGGGRTSVGEIQPDGTFTLETDTTPGATPGEHRVTVLGPRSDEEDGPGRMTYDPPPDYTLRIAPDAENTFELDIRRENGWTPRQDD